MPFKNHKSALHQSGFSLIELMVGMVIGLLAVLVIMQVFSVFEGQKRTTTGTADAQTNAAISLYSIQREALLAGFGLSLYGASNPLLCTTGPNLSAVTIVDGGAGAGASDSITFRYGNSPNGGIPVKINGVAGNIVGVDNNMGCQVGNDVLIADGANCIMTTVTGPTDIAIPPVPTSPPDTNHVQLASGAGVLNGSDLSCLGTWSTITFAINNNQLERNGTPIVSDIVNIQAQYGISNASNDNVIAQWVNATGAWAAPAAAEGLFERRRQPCCW